MVTAYRETIMSKVAELLGNIVTDTGRTWALSTTPRVIRSRLNAIECTTYPFVYIAAKDEVYGLRATTSASQQYDRTMRLGIEFYVNGLDLDTLASKVVHDVELALANFTLTGTVDDCYFESSRILQGDSDTAALAGVEFVLVVRYRTNNSDPTTRV